MKPKKEKAPIGKNPIDAHTAYGIQSKAVIKDNEFRNKSFTSNPDAR
jgi:hypothetical protein